VPDENGLVRNGGDTGDPTRCSDCGPNAMALDMRIKAGSGSGSRPADRRLLPSNERAGRTIAMVCRGRWATL